ncbi:hypothetical protein HDU84_005620 [Entophlyctis sp. JEL0112]|nr:hypothetical protein HDU84_005620 [Entophlyctis sp. JEL0112]
MEEIVKVHPEAVTAATAAAMAAEPAAAATTTPGRRTIGVAGCKRDPKEMADAVAARAATEASSILSGTAAALGEDLARQVEQHVAGIRAFMDAELRKGGVFLDTTPREKGTENSAVDNAAALLAAEERRRRLKQENVTARQKRTGRGRRLLALKDGGTGEVCAGYLTQRADFKPLPISDTTKIKFSENAEKMLHQPSKFANKSKEASSHELYDPASKNNDGIETEFGEFDQPEQHQRFASPQKKISYDEGRLQNTIKDECLRVTDWPTFENCDAVNEGLKIPKPWKEPDFISYASSDRGYSGSDMQKIIRTQNERIQNLAEEVLGPLHFTEHLCDDKEVIAKCAENDEHPSSQNLPKNSEKVAFSNSDSFEFIAPVQLFQKFSHSSARLLDARNKRIDPTLSEKVIQPKFRTNPHSIKIQSSVYQVSEPPSMSAASFVSESKLAEACALTQYKMAPTLQVERKTKPNPKIVLPERKTKGSLEDIFGIESSSAGIAETVLKRFDFDLQSGDFKHRK